jgi:hypothetical protein
MVQAARIRYEEEFREKPKFVHVSPRVYGEIREEINKWKPLFNNPYDSDFCVSEKCGENTVIMTSVGDIYDHKDIRKKMVARFSEHGVIETEAFGFMGDNKKEKELLEKGGVLLDKKGNATIIRPESDININAGADDELTQQDGVMGMIIEACDFYKKKTGLAPEYVLISEKNYEIYSIINKDESEHLFSTRGVKEVWKKGDMPEGRVFVSNGDKNMLVGFDGENAEEVIFGGNEKKRMPWMEDMTKAKDAFIKSMADLGKFEAYRDGVSDTIMAFTTEKDSSEEKPEVKIVSSIDAEKICEYLTSDKGKEATINAVSSVGENLKAILGLNDENGSEKAFCVTDFISEKIHEYWCKNNGARPKIMEVSPYIAGIFTSEHDLVSAEGCIFRGVLLRENRELKGEEVSFTDKEYRLIEICKDPYIFKFKGSSKKFKITDREDYEDMRSEPCALFVWEEKSHIPSGWKTIDHFEGKELGDLIEIAWNWVK